MNWNMDFDISDDDTIEYKIYWKKWKIANDSVIYRRNVHYLDDAGNEIKREIPELFLHNQCRYDWICELYKRNLLKNVEQEELVFSFRGVFFRQIHEDFLKIDDRKGNVVDFWQVAYSLQKIESGGVDRSLVQTLDRELNSLVISDLYKEFSVIGILNVITVLCAWFEFRREFYKTTDMDDKIYDYEIVQGLYKKSLDSFKKLRNDKFWPLWEFGIFVVWIYNRCSHVADELELDFLDYQGLAISVWRDILASAHRNGFDDEVPNILKIITKMKNDEFIDESDYRDVDNSMEHIDRKMRYTFVKNTYNNNFGEISGNFQIQQGTINSTQIQNNISNDKIDFEECSKIIEEIKKYEAYFDSEFKDKSSEAKEALYVADEAVRNKDSGALKKALLDLKNFAEGVGASVVASGILHLINGLSFFAV